MVSSIHTSASDHQETDTTAQTSQTANQNVSPETRESLQTSTSEKRVLSPWYPLWLRRVFLVAFTTLLALFWVSLVVLWYLNNKLDGFSLSLNNHYAWTYGPTAVLVIVVSLWRQVDHCCKINQPWQELRAGPRPASQNVLLDYMWPLQINSFIAAIRNRHFAVVASISLFVTLKVAIVVSTGLFLLDESSFSDQIPIKLKMRFDGAQFWSAALPQGIFVPPSNAPVPVYLLGGEFDKTTYDNISSDPIWLYMNNNDVAVGMPLPAIEMTNAMTNYTIVSPPNRDVYETSAAVEVFMPSIKCAPVELSYNKTLSSTSMDIVLETSDCSIGAMSYPLCFYSTVSDGCLVLGNTYQIDRVNCSGTGTTDSVYLDNRTQNTYQYAITALEYTLLNATENQTGPIWEWNLTGTVTRAVAVLCKFSYDIGQHLAVTDGSDADHIKSIEYRLQGTTYKIDNFTDLQFSEALFSTLTAGRRSGMFDTNGPIADLMGGYALINLMARNVSIDAPLDSLLDRNVLAMTAENVLTNIGHQLMRRYFLVPDDEDAMGTYEYRQIRLHMRPAALWVMVGLFGLSSTLPVVIMMTRSTAVAPESISTMATNLTIFRSSPAMHHLLYDSGAKRNSEIRHDMQGLLFEAPSMDQFMIEMIGSFEIEPPKPTMFSRLKSRLNRLWCCARRSNEKIRKPKKKAEWMPFAARRDSLVLTLLLPLLAIAALEVLWYFSQHRTSFINTDGNSSAVAYAIRYSCTTIALIIATLMNNLDFAVAVMTPYNVLGAGRAAARRSLFFSVAGDLPPVVLYKTIRHRHFGAAFSIAASTIGSVLTIIVSGLWVLDDSVRISKPVTVMMDTRWDFALKAGSEGDNGAAEVFNAIQHGNADESDLIWQGYILPVVGNVTLDTGSLTEFVSTLNSTSVQYEFEVPTVQPYLDCEIVPESGLSVNVTYLDGPGDIAANTQYSFEVVVELPTGCTFSNISGPQSVSFGQKSDVANRDGGYWVWLGSTFDLRVVGSASAVNGCPSIGGYYGRYNSDVSNYTFTPFVCSQRVQEVQASVTFYGDWSRPIANLSDAPRTDLQSTKVLHNSSDGLNSLSFATIKYLDSGVSSFSSGADEIFDGFFNFLTWGPGGVSHESILGPGNSANLISAMNKLYQGYMSHVIDLNFRSSSDTASRNALTGAATGLGSRLKINETSKIILQVMLGVISILGSVAYWLTDLRDTIPRSPCSIASTMAFFAGSSLVTRDIGVEQHSHGEDFSLGWWDVEVLPATTSETSTQCLSGQITTQSQIQVHRIKRKPVANRGETLSRRFAVDKGTPNMLGFRKKSTRWWHSQWRFPLMSRKRPAPR